MLLNSFVNQFLPVELTFWAWYVFMFYVEECIFPERQISCDMVLDETFKGSKSNQNFTKSKIWCCETKKKKLNLIGHQIHQVFVYSDIFKDFPQWENLRNMMIERSQGQIPPMPQPSMFRIPKECSLCALGGRGLHSLSCQSRWRYELWAHARAPSVLKKPNVGSKTRT